jgi:hypothetical protein
MSTVFAREPRVVVVWFASQKLRHEPIEAHRHRNQGRRRLRLEVLILNLAFIDAFARCDTA